MKTINKYIAAAVCVLGLGSVMTSCSKLFEEDSTYYIDADEEHLNNATDSIYSAIGILNKLQAIADRTILFGEARGDLVNVTSVTSSDLRQIANFNVDDDNAYNDPRDYYAIINNCNYFIAHADTALKNNRNENIFMKEYAVVKAVRAWTYLQLVTTYGTVPFITEPILSKEDSEKDYQMYGIQDVCNYFLNQDGLQSLVDIETPSYGDIKSLPSKMFYIPIRLVLGDLALWAGKYTDAAKYYHDYLNNKNGVNSVYPVSTNCVEWTKSSFSLLDQRDRWTSIFEANEEVSSDKNKELITIIPMDSIPSEGYYSQLRSIFNTSYAEDNNYQVSLVPSQAIEDISEAQTFCFNNDGDIVYVPKSFTDNSNGDLRLSSAWSTRENYHIKGSSQSVTYQNIYKYQTKNVHIYRRALVYLRLAEALNRAGYPRYAFQILSSGVNNEVLQDSVIPHYQADSLYIMENFAFKGDTHSATSSAYVVNTNPYNNISVNTIGLHSRGSGFTPSSIYYQMPYNADITDSLEQIAYQQQKVEQLIMDEEALEFAFEGYRYYDLLRVALRHYNDDGDLYKRYMLKNPKEYIKDNIEKRGGTLPSVDLTDIKNWFISYKNQLGYQY